MTNQSSDHGRSRDASQQAEFDHWISQLAGVQKVELAAEFARSVETEREIESDIEQAADGIQRTYAHGDSQEELIQKEEYEDGVQDNLIDLARVAVEQEKIAANARREELERRLNTAIRGLLDQIATLQKKADALAATDSPAEITSAIFGIGQAYEGTIGLLIRRAKENLGLADKLLRGKPSRDGINKARDHLESAKTILAEAERAIGGYKVEKSEHGVHVSGDAGSVKVGPVTIGFGQVNVDLGPTGVSASGTAAGIEAGASGTGPNGSSSAIKAGVTIGNVGATVGAVLNKEGDSLSVGFAGSASVVDVQVTGERSGADVRDVSGGLSVSAGVGFGHSLKVSDKDQDGRLKVDGQLGAMNLSVSFGAELSPAELRSALALTLPALPHQVVDAVAEAIMAKVAKALKRKP